MRKAVKIMLSLALIFAFTFGNYAFALDEVQAQPVEPGYKDIVEDIFPGYWDEPVSYTHLRAHET